MADERHRAASTASGHHILTAEQDLLLDMYLKKLDDYLEHVKESEKMEVEIETLHLKRLLSE